MFRRNDYRLYGLEKRTAVLFEENNQMRTDMIKLKTHVGKLTKQVEDNTNYGKKSSKEIERLIEHTGANDDYVTLITLGWGSIQREFKSFNLTEKINAIMAYLNLAESVTQPNKLITAPKKKESK